MSVRSLSVPLPFSLFLTCASDAVSSLQHARAYCVQSAKTRMSVRLILVWCRAGGRQSLYNQHLFKNFSESSATHRIGFHTHKASVSGKFFQLGACKGGIAQSRIANVFKESSFSKKHQKSHYCRMLCCSMIKVINSCKMWVEYMFITIRRTCIHVPLLFLSGVATVTLTHHWIRVFILKDKSNIATFKSKASSTSPKSPSGLNAVAPQCIHYSKIHFTYIFGSEYHTF